MIDFELLAKDLGPDPALALDQDIVPPVGDEEHGDDEAEAAARREAGFEPVVDLPPIEDSYDIDDSDETDTDLPLEIVKGLIHQGTKAIIGGGSKSCKTWTLLDLAHSVAYGVPWLGFQCNPGPVLYINMEIHPVFFKKRIRKVRAAKGIQKVRQRLDLWNLRGKAASYRILVPRIIKAIKDKGYVLVVLDPLYKIYGSTDENSASETGQLLNELERVCVETNAAVVFGSHYSKGNQSSKEAIDRVSGSGVFARDPDTILPFTKHEEEGCFTVEPILRNLPPVEPFVVRWNHPLMEIDEDLNPENLKQVNKAGKKKAHDPLDILRFIKDRTKDNPVSVAEWSRISNLPRTTIQDYLVELREYGFIATVGEGQTARKYITDLGLKQVV